MDTTNEIESKKEATEFLAENLVRLLHFHKINESELAKNLQIPYNTIHRLLTGTTSDPRISTIQQIADYFGVTLDYLMSKNLTNQFIEQKITAIPIVGWNCILDPHFTNQLQGNDHRRWMQIPQMKNRDDSGQLFAIESTKSMQPRFPIGTTFIVNLKEEPLDGDLVLIRFKDNTVSLRELIIDSPDWQLKATVPGSNSLIFNHKENEILGVVTLTIIQTRPVLAAAN